jgi:hypothetical protein
MSSNVPSSLAESFVIVGDNNASSSTRQPTQLATPAMTPTQGSTPRSGTPVSASGISSKTEQMIKSSHLRRVPSITEPIEPPVKVSSYAHDWSRAATNGGLYLHGRHFIDGFGRVCLPRGVNLSGNCKRYVFILNFYEFW